MEIKDFLTPREREQMEKLMRTAEERKEKSLGLDDDTISFRYLQFRCKSRNPVDAEKTKKKAEPETELQRLMEQACRFCQRNGFCEDRKKCREYDEDDEELPLGIFENSDESDDEKAEWQQQYQAGRLSMLFSLVDRGKLTLDEAAEYAGMTWGEAEDMLQGWREAQRM